jgi:2-dehydropantoate 2-reductase
MNGVTIVGAGGIGCAVGYALRIAGIDVTFVECDRDKVAWGKTRGVLVDRNPTQSAEFVHFNEWLPDAKATVLLCTKCYDNSSVLERVPDTVTLIPIQNGFDQALKNPRVALEGIASFVSECYPHQSHTRITRTGKLHLGGRSSARPSNKDLQGKLTSLGEALSQARLFQVEMVPDILPYKHTKLMYNAAISPLAAAAGLHNGQLLSVPAARRWFFDLLRENYTILSEAGVMLGKVGPFHPHTVSRILSSRMISRMLSWAFYPSLRGTYCSMYADLPAGRTEVDYYNRYLIDLAGDRPCPANRRIYELVKKMERERIAPGLHLLKELDES